MFDKILRSNAVEQVLGCAQSEGKLEFKTQDEVEKGEKYEENNLKKIRAKTN